MHIVGAVLSVIAFVGGLKVMRHGFEGMAGGRLERIVKQLAKTPTRGIVTGAVATACLQSSAALTAITVGLVASRSLTFRNGLGLILGSNVGSTLTPQMLNLNLWGLVGPTFAVGLICILLQRKALRAPGEALIGFSCIFIALQTLKLFLSPLANSTWFADGLRHAGSHALIAITAGCFASAIVQSSTAVTVMTMAFTANHLMSPAGAIGIVLGANIGTCLTSVIASIGESRQAQQVAAAHVILNVLGAFVFLPFLPSFASLMQALSENAAQQIANAHTLFNVVCTVLVWPFTGQFARFIERILPEQAQS